MSEFDLRGGPGRVQLRRWVGVSGRRTRWHLFEWGEVDMDEDDRSRAGRSVMRCGVFHLGSVEAETRWTRRSEVAQLSLAGIACRGCAMDMVREMGAA